jgi:hypothetical protein
MSIPQTTPSSTTCIRRRFCSKLAKEKDAKAAIADLNIHQDILMEVLPHRQLEALAARTNAQDQRKRKLTCVVFFWLMILTVGPGGPVSLSSIASHLLVACTISGMAVAQAALSRQALSENLKVRPWQFFEAVLDHLLVAYRMLAEANAPKLRLDLIHHLRIIDTSTLRVADRLIQVFPGHRTNRNQAWAAVKLHAAFRFFRSVPQVLALTAERDNDKKIDFLIPQGEKALYVFDLGYWKYHLFDTILDRGQHFISRLQEKCNPLILAVTLGDPNWVGQRLRSVCLAEFAEIDLWVNVSSEGPSNPKMKHDLRLVGQLAYGNWHFYLTSIWEFALYPVDLIAQIYAIRWQIEIFFRDLKCVLRIQNLIATNENGVRIQIYAALIYYVLTHLMMLKAAQQVHVSVEQMSVPKCLRAVAQTLSHTVDLVVKDREPDWSTLEQCLVDILIGVHRRSVRKHPSRLAQAADRVLTPVTLSA